MEMELSIHADSYTVSTCNVWENIHFNLWKKEQELQMKY